MMSFYPTRAIGFASGGFNSEFAPFSAAVGTAMSYKFNVRNTDPTSAMPNLDTFNREYMLQWRGGVIQIYYWNSASWNSIGAPTYSNVSALWDYFFQTRLSPSSPLNDFALIDQTAYDSNSPYYNELFGAHLKDYFRSQIQVNLTAAQAETANFPSSEAALLISWQNYLTQVGSTQYLDSTGQLVPIAPQQQLPGPYGLADSDTGLNPLLGFSITERRHDGFYWVAKTILRIMSDLNTRLSNQGSEVQRLNNMATAVSPYQVALTALQNYYMAQAQAADESSADAANAKMLAEQQVQAQAQTRLQYSNNQKAVISSAVSTANKRTTSMTNTVQQYQDLQKQIGEASTSIFSSLTNS